MENENMVEMDDEKKRMILVKPEKATEIRTLEDVELLRPLILKKQYKGFYISNLTMQSMTKKDKDGNETKEKSARALVSDLMVTPNRQTRTMLRVIEKDAEVLTAKGITRTRPFYTKALLNIEYDDSNAMLFSEHKKVYRKGEGIDTKFYVIADGNVLDLIEGKTYEKEDEDCPDLFDEDGNMKEGVIAYNSRKVGAMTCSPGQIKRHNITMVAENLPGFDAKDSWDKVTYGADVILVDEYQEKGEENTKPKDVAQGNTRLSAYKSPSEPIAEVGAVAYIMGKLTFLGTKDEYRDGFAFLNAEYLSAAFTKLTKGAYHFAPLSTDGLMVQCRPWLNKVMAEAVSRKYIKEFLEFLFPHQEDVVVLTREEITKEEQEAFQKGVMLKGKSRNLTKEEKKAGKKDYGGKLVVILSKAQKESVVDENGKVDFSKLEFLTDLNGLKAPYDLKRRSCINALDMSHENHDWKYKSNTSTQLIQSLMIIDPVKCELIVKRLGSEFLQRKKEELLSEEGKAPSWTDFVSKTSEKFRPDYQMIVGRIAPQFAWKHYAPLWHSLVDNAIEGFMRRVRKLNIPTAGAYTKIVPDTAADFGVKILGIDKETTEIEVVCPVASKHKIERLIGVKYPKMHFFEYMKGRVITWKEYWKRVDENDKLTDGQKAVIKEHVKHLSGGAIMIPAVEHLKNMLAGMDFDGDACQLFFDKDIVDVLFKGQTKAVIIDEDSEEEVKKAKEEAQNRPKSLYEMIKERQKAMA